MKKNGVKYNWSRRDFLKISLILSLGTQFFKSCQKSIAKVVLRLTGTNHILAHRLWVNDFPAVSAFYEIPYLILGAGITGLSAAYRLNQFGIKDYLVLDLEDEVGGNSRSGENEYSKYPIGAHYLPIPNASNVELLDFLKEVGIIKGVDSSGLPIFDEEQLSFAPQSRLFIHNYWQTGIVPSYGLTDEEVNELERFHEAMGQFSVMKGDDGKYIFNIPLAHSSANHDLISLDQITMKDWLYAEGFSSSNLFSYVDYCCRDDFGIGIEKVSAFAGIHYFSARKHDLIDLEDVVLTWSEGNARLAKQLAKFSENRYLCNHLVYKITMLKDSVEVYVYDDKQKKSKCFKVKKVISCLPQFVNQYIFPSRKESTKAFHYSPWIVATIVLKRFPFADGATLSWDNVIHGGKGLGYIYNQHQSLAQFKSPFVISYYYSMSDGDLKSRRKELYNKTDSEWKDFIIKDLSIAHFHIEEEISSIEIFRHGHGMISPVPGFLTSQERKEMAEPLGDKVYFAHSDLSGISIFEEAFYQGIQVVDRIFNK